MFGQDFYPTPLELIEKMIDGEPIKGKVILEPSAGKGDIVDYCQQQGAEVIACEINDDLRKILATKCQVIENDFLTLTSDKISHVHYIVMNPPFSTATAHILHAFDIAPAGCKIIALCNSQTIENTYTEARKRLKQIIDENGQAETIQNGFNEAERKTGVEISLIRISKPGASYNSEFEGFFMDEEPQGSGEVGLMPYNVIRDLVQRYTGAIRIFDEQLNQAVKMNELTSGFYSAGIGLNISKDKAPITRNEFKKELQKSGWKFIFSKLNMQKYATKGLREDINKFVETQTNIPFTMKNIYKMLEIVIGTNGQRMDKALLEVFEKVINHSDENKFYGAANRWKTNGYYLLTEKFILPYMTEVGWSGELSVKYSGNSELIEDMQKALCFITGDNYDELTTLSEFFRYTHRDKPAKNFGTWYDWGFFEVRGYKKGTMHFKFKDQDLWAKFNQRIGKLKGYPLYSHSDTAPKQKPAKQPAQEFKTLFTIKLQTA